MSEIRLALSKLPQGLLDPLLSEYAEITQNYFERRWGDTTLKAGRFCEIVYTIVEGVHQGAFPASPHKPSDFVGACRQFEKNKSVPRSMQILIPRLLPVLYEIRNNRDSGHVGGEVSSNSMDANAVYAMVSWLMGELVRNFSSISVEESQNLVDRMTERKIPLVWDTLTKKRVLKSSMSKKDQCIVLLASKSERIGMKDLMDWVEYSNSTNFKKLLKDLHNNRFVEFDQANSEIEITPLGLEKATKIIKESVDSK